MNTSAALLLLTLASASADCGVSNASRVGFSRWELLLHRRLLRVKLTDSFVTSYLYFRVHSEEQQTGNDTEYHFCVGLASLDRITMSPMKSYCKENFGFNPDFSVGYITISSWCWVHYQSRNGSCVLEAWMSEEVAALNIFRYDSTKREFWNFDSDLYSSERDWFWTLSFKPDGDFAILDQCQVDVRMIYTLQNTSIRSFSLAGNWPLESKNITLGLMPRLKYLAFVLSFVDDFISDAYMFLPALEELVFLGNSLTAMPANLGKIKSLKRLVVSMNNLEVSHKFTFDCKSLEGLDALEELDISGNNIRSIHGNLPPLPQLKKLNLSSNYLHSLETLLFDLPALYVLDLSSNNFSRLDVGHFSSLKELQYLNLSRNSLTEWPMLYGHSLQMLDISRNNISRVLTCDEQLAVVDTVDASANIISGWDAVGAFTNGDHRCVRSANLSLNSIPSASTTMCDSLKALDWVDLGGNPLDCASCDTPTLRSWLQSSSTRVLSLGQDSPLLCSSPGLERGTPVVDVRFDESQCRQPVSLALAVGAPLGVAASIFIVTGAVVYRFRFEVTYLFHLVAIRKRAKMNRGEHRQDFFYDAFICYSGSDRPWVIGTLMPFLEGEPHRYRLCLHDRDFRLGSVIVRNIIFSIENSRKTVIILSKEFMKSKWCQWELDMANHRLLNAEARDFLILLELERLDRSVMPLHLKFLIDTRTHLEWPIEGDTAAKKRALAKVAVALGPSLFSGHDERAPLLYP